MIALNILFSAIAVALAFSLDNPLGWMIAGASVMITTTIVLLAL
jgi:hypothetical protein